jgi:hypothetical protein
VACCVLEDDHQLAAGRVRRSFAGTEPHQLRIRPALRHDLAEPCSAAAGGDVRAPDQLDDERSARDMDVAFRA